LNSSIITHSHYGEIIKGGTLVLFLRALSAIVTFLLTVRITNYLGAEQSGYYFFIISFLMFLTSIISFGVYNAILKEVSINIRNKVKVSNIMTRAFLVMFFGYIIVSVFLILYNYISINYSIASHSIINNFYYEIIIYVFPFSLLMLLSNYFQANKNLFLSILYMNLGYQFLMYLSTNFYNITTVSDLLTIFGYSLFFIVVVGVYWYVFRHGNSFMLTKVYSFSDLLTLSFPMMVGGIIQQISSFTGQLLLSIYSTPIDISYYAVSMRIGMVMSLFLMAIHKIVNPKIAVLYFENNFDDLNNIIIFSNRILLFISMVLFLLIVSFGEVLLGFFGNEFIIAYPVLIIVSIGQFIASISGLSVFILQMANGEKVNRNIIIFSSIISSIIGIIIIPYFGVLGAAVMTLVSLSLLNISATYKVYKIYKINPLKLY
jgi:O-antigen/teichoic acid export membrane protein